MAAQNNIIGENKEMAAQETKEEGGSCTTISQLKITILGKRFLLLLLYRGGSNNNRTSGNCNWKIIGGFNGWDGMIERRKPL